MNLANELLEEMLAITKPDKDALDEARARRDVVKDAALAYDGALDFIKSGSLAHHTVNGTVSDADGSLILDRRVYKEYGPDGDGTGPSDLILGIAENIRDIVQQVYPNVWISTNHTHAIYFRFRDPLPDGQDPTVDLVIGLNRKDQPGLWIPNLKDDTWEPSHPAKHSELVRVRRQATAHTSSKVVRALKLFSKQWDNELLTSFHLTALMLESYPARKTIIGGVIDVLDHAANSLDQGNTNDPAGVSGPLYLPEGREKSTVLSRLSNAASKLRSAVEVEGDDDTSLDEVVDSFGEVFSKSKVQAILDEAALAVRRKILDKVIQESSKDSAPVVSPAFNNRPVLNTRAFASKSQSPVRNITDEIPAINLKWFEAGIDKSSHFILHRSVGKNSITYVVNVQLPDRSGTQLVTVKISGSEPSVVAHGQQKLRHVNSDGTLCLWYPSDPVARKWTQSKGLLSLLDLIGLHLYKEARFKVTGDWPGDEVHND